MGIETELFDKIKKSMPIPCVDLLVAYKNSLLLMLRNNEPAKDLWFTPGGRIYRNEKLIDTVKRVLPEETGLQPTKITQVSTMSHIWPEAHTVTTYFRVEVDSDKVKLDPQHSDYKWIDKMEEDLHPYIVEMIENSGVFK